MKRQIICMGGLLLLVNLFGCSGAHREETTATTASASAATAVAEIKTETPVPAAEALQILLSEEDEEKEERILDCISIDAEALPFSVDLDGDGTEEVVDLVPYTGADEYPRWAVSLTRDGREQRYETEIPCDTWHDLFAADLDEDGMYELFFDGDLASDDYLLYAFRHDLAPIPFEADERLYRCGQEERTLTFDARIDSFEDGHLVVGGSVDMLGTHYGVRSFDIREDGAIAPLSSAWEFDEPEDRALTVKRELTAYRANPRKDPGEAFVLSPGDRIHVLASDGCERVWFRTDKGKGGVLLLTADEDQMWLIDEVPEAEYFESLPYAG